MMEDYVEITDIKFKQKLLLIILKKFHNICEKYGLKYYIYGGTLLGAVRHNGFIPWDDDIDVTMPRQDYNRFISLIKEKHNEDFVLYVYPKDDYIYPYIKLGMPNTVLIEKLVSSPFNRLALNIDVFPDDVWDGEYEKFDKYEKNEKKIIFSTYKLNVKGFKNYVYYKFFKFYYKNIVGIKNILNKQVHLLDNGPVKNCEFVICQGAGLREKGIINKKDYDKRKLYKFEDIEVYGIENYRTVLTKIYGDYEQLPPKEDRHPPHDTLLYVKNDLIEKLK